MFEFSHLLFKFPTRINGQNKFEKKTAKIKIFLNKFVGKYSDTFLTKVHYMVQIQIEKSK